MPSALAGRLPLPKDCARVWAAYPGAFTRLCDQDHRRSTSRVRFSPKFSWGRTWERPSLLTAVGHVAEILAVKA